MCQIAIDAKEIIEANVVDPLSVDELANVFGIDRCTLARKFKRHHGYSMQDLRLELSRNRIMRWVDTTNLSGNEIAIRLGCSKQNIHYAVKASTGMTFVGYRKQLSGASQ